MSLIFHAFFSSPIRLLLSSSVGPRNQSAFFSVFYCFFFCSSNRFVFNISQLAICYRFVILFYFFFMIFIIFRNFSSIHNVHIRTEGDFAAGKRVYLQGKLRSTFQTLPDTGRNVTCSIVKAHQLYVLENESASLDPTEGDQNQVELLAHISSEVLHKDNHSTFAVATHFKRT